MKIPELVEVLDHGMVEELTVYFMGKKKIYQLRYNYEDYPDYPIAKMWQSETGRGISVLLADSGE